MRNWIFEVKFEDGQYLAYNREVIPKRKFSHILVNTITRRVPNRLRIFWFYLTNNLIFEFKFENGQHRAYSLEVIPKRNFSHILVNTISRRVLNKFRIFRFYLMRNPIFEFKFENEQCRAYSREVIPKTKFSHILFGENLVTLICI